MGWHLNSTYCSTFLNDYQYITLSGVFGFHRTMWRHWVVAIFKTMLFELDHLISYPETSQQPHFYLLFHMCHFFWILQLPPDFEPVTSYILTFAFIFIQTNYKGPKLSKYRSENVFLRVVTSSSLRHLTKKWLYFPYETIFLGAVFCCLLFLYSITYLLIEKQWSSPSMINYRSIVDSYTLPHFIYNLIKLALSLSCGV